MNSHRKPTNLELLQHYKITTFSSSFPIKEISTKLSDFIGKCCRMIYGDNVDDYNIRMTTNEVIENLFKSQQKLTLFQCVYRAFQVNQAERKRLLKLYIKMDAENSIRQLFMNVSDFQKQVNKIETFSSSKELLVKYIRHVVCCEGYGFLSDSDESDYLNSAEKYYLIELVNKYS